MTNSAKRQPRAKTPANELSTDDAGQNVGPVELAGRSGNYLAVLVALRQRLADVLDNCRHGRDVAPVAKALADVLGLINAEERRLGQQSRTSDSNDAVVRSLAAAAAVLVPGEVPSGLL